MGPVDILLLLAVALIAGLAVRSIIKRRKSGGSYCGCGCSNCSKCSSPSCQPAADNPLPGDGGVE